MIEIFEQFTSQKIGGDSFGSGSFGYVDVLTEKMITTPVINKNISVNIEVIVHSQPQAHIGKLAKTKNFYSLGQAASRVMQKSRGAHIFSRAIGGASAVAKTRAIPAWSKAGNGGRSIFGIKDFVPVVEYLVTDELDFIMTQDGKFLVTNNTKNLK